MSGAQRNQRKRNQRASSQAQRAVASARGSNKARNTTIAAVVVVVVIAAAVIGGVLYSNSQRQAQADAVIKTSQVASNYPVKVNDGVIVAGKDSAKVKLDFYEDLICPSCGLFNKFYADDVEKQLEAGTVQVNYHMVPPLNENSSPPGYSQRAAAATVAVAANSPGKFASFERSLFDDQPEEGGAGYTDDQLISLGKRLGAGGNFEQDVRSGKYKNTIQQVFQRSRGPVSKANGGSGYSTPTILNNGERQEWVRGSSQNPQKTDWLQKLVANKG